MNLCNNVIEKYPTNFNFNSQFDDPLSHAKFQMYFNKPKCSYLNRDKDNHSTQHYTITLIWLFSLKLRFLNKIVILHIQNTF
jgi:hypothetical protein